MARSDDAVVLEIDGHEVRVTSPGKVLFDERGETKLDLVQYYLAVGEPIMRTMGGRPVLMQRFPHGAGGNSFYQKRVPDNAPDWLSTTIVSTPNGTTSRALVVEDLAHIAWAVNLGCLGFHVWPSLAADPGHADELRIDLDPQPGVAFEEARAAARDVKDLFDELGMTAHPKTTGNRGIHIYVRLEPKWDSFEVRAAAVALARELARRNPALITDAWWKEERGERIFVDFNQNSPHKTVFGAWCVRARPGRAGVDAVRVGRARHDRQRSDDDGDGARPRRSERRSVGALPRRAAVARAVARDVGARSRERLAGCAVAARVPEDAGRATARRAEPRAEERSEWPGSWVNPAVVRVAGIGRVSCVPPGDTPRTPRP